jgi:alkylation response protein AidB-like acyl-CoA dehydrogenase
VDFTYSDEDEAFRAEVRRWLDEHLTGAFAALGPGNDMGGPETLAVRLAWERELAEGGWVGLAWPERYGGRDASLTAQQIFKEEYARADGPVRCGFFGEQLLGPTLMAFGTPEQQERFLGPILRAEELWCQGFSEPDAGSDLANITTAAVRDGDRWRITGQKVWTSLGHIADWIFVICRTDPTARQHRGLSFLLCPMDQPGVEVRPIRQLTGTAEFNEVFFDGASTPADLAQQLRFAAEFRQLVAAAHDLGVDTDPTIRQRLGQTYIGLEIMRWTGLRTITQLLQGRPLGPESSIGKLHWSRWHQQLGELAMHVHGAASLVHGSGRLADLQYTFQFSRSHTIYAGSSEIQRNIIGERVLGLPKEPSGR